MRITKKIVILKNKKDFLKHSHEGRLIALDVGTKTIGIAVTDDTRSMSFPSETLLRKGNQKDIPILLDIFKNKKITGVIMGLPISFEEKDTDSSLFVKRFAENLSIQTELPIVFHDERLSSFEAEDLMLDKVGYHGTKKVVDKIAASFILEGFLSQDL